MGVIQEEDHREISAVKLLQADKKEMKTGTYTVSNLTPDSATGRIYHWSQQAFINRFRAKRIYPDDFMPWEAFSKMSDNDLKAIYNFLHTLKPVQNKIEQTYIPTANTNLSRTE
jgi:hypothetical protein